MVSIFMHEIAHSEKKLKCYIRSSYYECVVQMSKKEKLAVRLHSSKGANILDFTVEMFTYYFLNFSDTWALGIGQY